MPRSHRGREHHGVSIPIASMVVARASSGGARRSAYLRCGAGAECARRRPGAVRAACSSARSRPFRRSTWRVAQHVVVDQVSDLDQMTSVTWASMSTMNACRRDVAGLPREHVAYRVRSDLRQFPTGISIARPSKERRGYRRAAAPTRLARCTAASRGSEPARRRVGAHHASIQRAVAAAGERHRTLSTNSRGRAASRCRHRRRG